MEEKKTLELKKNCPHSKFDGYDCELYKLYDGKFNSDCRLNKNCPFKQVQLKDKMIEKCKKYLKK